MFAINIKYITYQRRHKLYYKWCRDQRKVLKLNRIGYVGVGKKSGGEKGPEAVGH